MERLDTDVSSFESALHKAPKVFESIGVNATANVLNRMVNNFVEEFSVQSFVRGKGIRVERRPCQYVLADFGLQDAFLPVIYHHGTHFTVALQESHDRSFVASASAVNLLGSFVL